MRYAWQDSVDRALAYQRPRQVVRQDRAPFDESKVKRGQPGNAGQFAHTAAGSFRPTGGSAGGPGNAAKTGQREGRYASTGGDRRPADHAVSSAQHRVGGPAEARGHHPPGARGRPEGPKLKPSQREGRAPTSEGPHGSIIAMLTHKANNWTQEDYELLHETFNKVSKKQRRSIGHAAVDLAAMPVKFLANHLKDEAVHAVYGVGALLYMTAGKKPSEKQVSGLKHLTTKTVLTLAAMAVGDVTGLSGAAVAHGATAAAHAGVQVVQEVAEEFGHHVVQHVIFEHTAQIFWGGVRATASKASSIKRGVKTTAKKVKHAVTRRHDAEESDEDNRGLDDLSPEEVKLLSQWFEALGEAIETLDEETAERILAEDANLDQDIDLGLDDDEEGDDQESAKPARQDNQLVRDFNLAEDYDTPFAWVRYVENLIGPFHTGLDRVRHDDASTWDESKINRVPEGSSEGGQFASQGGAGGGGAEGGETPAPHKPITRSFISPSVAEHMNFGEAAKDLRSGKRHQMLETTSREVDSRLGLLSRNVGIIGAWSDGAENSVMTETEDADWETLKVGVAMKAFLANQKAALIFQDAEEGTQGPEGSEPAHLISFVAQGNVDKIHQDLLSDGVDFHSIVPTRDGAIVYNVDVDGTRQASMEEAAKRYGTKPRVQFGHAEFIGNKTNKGDNDHAQRHEAQLAYAGIIKKSRVDGAQAIWKRIRPTYLRGFQVSEYTGETTTPLPDSKSSEPATISSVFPTAVNIVPGDKYRRADLKGMKGDATVFRDNMDLLKNPHAYPNLRPAETRGKAPDTIAKAAIKMAKANLRFLWEHATDEIRRDGPLWYEGAHNMAKAQAQRYGIPLQSMAGVYASLSPQKLWDQNVRLGDKLVAIYHDHQDTAWSPEMEAKAAEIWEPKDQWLLDRIKGKTLAELQLPAEKAVWIRTYDEAHNSQLFDRLSPDGRNLGTWVNLDGKPASNAWQNIYAIANAVIALESGGNREVLSLAMGKKNKVRSFYNNILDPHSANYDVTMDTHAIGAVLMRPETQRSTSVLQALATNPKKDKDPKKDKTPPGWKGARSSNKTGSSGTYSLWGDAYRELAEELGIEPRVLQSVTWVVKRQLFDDRMTEATRASVEAAWQGYHAGVRSFEDTQEEVWRLAGGIENKPPGGVADPAIVAEKAALAERRAARAAKAAAKNAPPEPEPEPEEAPEDEDEEEDA
jgi:hypothetical protein